MSRHHIVAMLALMALTSTCSAGEAKPEDSTGDQTGSEKSIAPPPAGLRTPTIDVSKPYGYHLEPILQKIKATPDQRTKIVVVVQSYRSKIQPLRDEYKQRRQEFITVMTGGAAAETIMAKQVELSHLASDITSKYTLMRLEVRRIMTPQQILQFEDYARQHGWNTH